MCRRPGPWWRYPSGQGERAGGRVVHLSRVQLRRSFVVSAKAETSCFSPVGTIANEAPRKSGKRPWMP